MQDVHTSYGEKKLQWIHAWFVILIKEGDSLLGVSDTLPFRY